MFKGFALLYDRAVVSIVWHSTTKKNLQSLSTTPFIMIVALIRLNQQHLWKLFFYAVTLWEGVLFLPFLTSAPPFSACSAFFWARIIARLARGRISLTVRGGMTNGSSGLSPKGCSLPSNILNFRSLSYKTHMKKPKRKKNSECYCWQETNLNNAKQIYLGTDTSTQTG